MPTNLYAELYTLLENVVFGGDASITPYTEWVTTSIATIGVVMMIALPFYVVYRIIRLLCG